MKLKVIKNLLLNSSNDERKDFFNELLINNPRNKKIQINKDYYDGKHWRFDNTMTSNTTRSGKNPWGEHYVSNSVDEYGRDKEGSGQMEDVTFSKGQLQVFNYTKLFALLYQDFSANSNNHLKVTIDSDKQTQDLGSIDYDSINNELKTLWNKTDLNAYSKSQIIRGYVYTVLSSNLVIDDDGVQVEPVDADELYPIYKGTKQYGTVRAYFVDKNEAKALGAMNLKGKDKKVIYTEVHVKIDNIWYFCVLIDGQFINELEQKADGLQFDPYSITPNIDHPFKKFNDYETEDSEINSIIEKNDSLNAYETMSHVSNSILALPRPVINTEMALAAGIDVNDEKFKDAARNFKPRPGVLTTMPIDYKAGENLGEAFYKKVDRVIDTMFEDAGVPRFLIDAGNLSQVSEETVMLGMSMLIRKIEQKRERLIQDIKKQSIKYLIFKGLLDPEEDYSELELDVNFADLTKLSNKDTLNYLSQYKDIFPSRFIQKKTLQLIGNGDEFDEVIQLEQGQSADMRSQLESIRQNRQARDTVLQNRERSERDQRRLEELNQQIENEQQ